MNLQASQIRVDKWLWAARFYKTRQLAIKALNNSQISLDKQTLKPASQVRCGDVIKIKRGAHELDVEILALNDKRGPAKVAQTLYQETQASQTRREEIKAQLALQPKIEIERRKPDRRKLRDSRAFKRGET